MSLNPSTLITPCGAMRDECNSLLQKSLRRGEADYARMATKELGASVTKEALVTMLLKDHCMTNYEMMIQVIGCIEEGDVYSAIDAILQCPTDRLVVSMQRSASTYKMYWWDTVVCDMPDIFYGLVEHRDDHLNVDLILSKMMKVWDEEEFIGLYRVFHLASATFEVEKRKITTKGRDMIELAGYTLPPGCRCHIIHVYLACLRLITRAPLLKKQIDLLFRITTLSPNMPMRLILYIAMVYRVYGNVYNETPEGFRASRTADWDSVPVLSDMPKWAVDHSTYRGSTGKSCLNIALKQHPEMSEEAQQVFHSRGKSIRTVGDYWLDGCQMSENITTGNPHIMAEMVAYGHRDNLCLTDMLHNSYRRWKEQIPNFFQKTRRETNTELLPPLPLKRKLEEEDEFPQTKKRAVYALGYDDDPSLFPEEIEELENLAAEEESPFSSPSEGFLLTPEVEIEPEEGPLFISTSEVFEPVNPLPVKRGRKRRRTTSLAAACKKRRLHWYELEGVDGPLLTRPTLKARVYTCKTNGQVKRGPFPKNQKKFNTTQCLTETLLAIGDQHTLPIIAKTTQAPYNLYWDLQRGPRATMNVTTEEHVHDPVSGHIVTAMNFIPRESLDIIRLSDLPLDQLEQIPASVIIHFLLRYCISAETKLDNVFTCSDRSFYYGVGLDNLVQRFYRRREDPVDALVTLLFSTLPDEATMRALGLAILRTRSELMAFFSAPAPISEVNGIFYKYDCDYTGFIQHRWDHIVDLLREVNELCGEMREF